jgi:hypothetical protein
VFTSEGEFAICEMARKSYPRRALLVTLSGRVIADFGLRIRPAAQWPDPGESRGLAAERVDLRPDADMDGVIRFLQDVDRGSF